MQTEHSLRASRLMLSSSFACKTEIASASSWIFWESSRINGEAALSENPMIWLKGPDGFRVSLSELWLAARVGAWLCCLPVALRLHSLPSLLEKMSLKEGRSDKRRRLEPVCIAQIVGRVCRMRLFDLPIFPRACLRRALALYSVFTRNAYPIEIYIGVRKD